MTKQRCRISWILKLKVSINGSDIIRKWCFGKWWSALVYWVMDVWNLIFMLDGFGLFLLECFMCFLSITVNWLQIGLCCGFYIRSNWSKIELFIEANENSNKIHQKWTNKTKFAYFGSKKAIPHLTRTTIFKYVKII